MTEQMHTPGPWKMVSQVNFNTGLTYTSVQPVTPDAKTMRPLLMMSGEFHVCRMTHTAARHAIEIHRANALLIAAAPDLLEALVELYGLISEMTGIPDEKYRIVTNAAAAIERASQAA